MDDPVLLTATAFALVAIPIMSVQLSKLKLKLVFLPPVLAMIISFPMFFFVMIVPGLPVSLPLFIISMSLWTGGFFGIFISIIVYSSKKKASKL